MELLVALTLLLQDRIERKCDAAVIETAAWCRTCDAAVEPDGKHDGHDVGKATVCVKKLWMNG